MHVNLLLGIIATKTVKESREKGTLIRGLNRLRATQFQEASWLGMIGHISKKIMNSIGK
jgi:hypothetical protein